LNQEIDTAVLDVIIPTQDSITQFQQQQTYLDNKEYQRENHKYTCSMLRIKNPNLPRLLSMLRSVHFKFWQPVAIWALYKMRNNPHLRSGILGDYVGLGKTWITVGFLLKVSLLILSIYCRSLYHTALMAY
jgi:hypothetical protein